MNKKIAVFLAVIAAGCSGTGGRFDPTTMDKRDAGSAANPVQQETFVPAMDPKRRIAEQDCSKPVDTSGGNLMCREVTAAERRAQAEEEERQARARREAQERAARERKEAEERAARERLERERAAAAALAAAALAARNAELERLAAERRRLEEEAARKAREERERQEKAEAEARARALAAQEAREAAERERQRLEHEWLAGRAMLENFIATYGNVAKFKGVSGQINTFLEKTR
jgi:flagellar biosynthesis GTPase FlhF